MFFRKAVILTLLFLAFSGALFQALAEPAEQTELNRDQVILRMVQFARAGRIAEAQDILRTYLEKNPSDGTMHYNLTCLDLLLGEREQALADLERALENGYTNFRLLQVDPDLDRLRDDPRLEPLVNTYQEKFIEEFQASSLYLDEGYQGSNLVLTAQDSSPTGVEPWVSVAFDARQLRVSIQIPDPDYVGEKPPWEDGCGVLVNLVHPVSPDDYDSRRYYSYGFFERDGRPEAVLVGKHGEVLLEPAGALQPTITRPDGQTRFEMVIPWEFFTPYSPLLDPEMGLNILYFGAGQGTDRPVYSLSSEKKMAFQPNTWRRYIPVFFLDSDRSTPVMRGRLYDRLTEGADLGLQLALWSAAEGDVECRLSIHPRDKVELTVGTPFQVKEPCELELNLFNYSLDLEEIPTGSYLLRAEMETPDEQVFVRDFPFDNFENGWLSSLDQRIHELDSPEKSILRYHLFLLTRQAEKRHPQSDASFLHAAFDRMESMIESSEAGHSILPDEGFFRGGISTGAMTMRFCAMHLPAGFKESEDLQILMVLPPAPNVENQLAQSLGAALAQKPGTVVLVPQSHGYSSLATKAAAEETVLAMQWAKALFNQAPITLVGLGDGADAALEASLLEPALCREILLDCDQLYRDLEGFSAEVVAGTLGDRVHQRLYTLTASQANSSRLDLVRAEMSALGFKVLVQPLGGQSLDSAWLSRWFLAKP